MIGQLKALTILAEQNAEQQKQKDAERKIASNYVDAVIFSLSEITEPTDLDYKPTDIEKTCRDLTRGLEWLDYIRFFLLTAGVDDERKRILSDLIDKKYLEVLDVLTFLEPVN